MKRRKKNVKHAIIFYCEFSFAKNRRNYLCMHGNGMTFNGFSAFTLMLMSSAAAWQWIDFSWRSLFVSISFSSQRMFSSSFCWLRKRMLEKFIWIIFELEFGCVSQKIGIYRSNKITTNIFNVVTEFMKFVIGQHFIIF